MKTKEQIIDYINSQPWKNAFYENAFKSILTPSYDEYTISDSFFWVDTKEGIGFWEEVCDAYMKWFENNEHEVTSWEEYCEKVPMIGKHYYYSECGNLTTIDDSCYTTRDPMLDVNVMPKELCEAFHAYMKLVQLKAYWDKDYDYNHYNGRYKIALNKENNIIFEPIALDKSPVIGFYFPTKKYANKFYETFKDLFEIAKPIL